METSVSAARGRRLLSVIKGSNLPIGYACRGRGVCTACAVWVSGDAGPIGDAESTLLERLDPTEETGRGVQRIACLARVNGDLKIRADYW